MTGTVNSLNSIIVEGVITTIPRLIDSDHTMCEMEIESLRIFRKDEEALHEVSHFCIVAEGRTAEICLKHLDEGNAIRVVGRLKEKKPYDEDSLPSLFILGEHIEFRPMKKAS